MTFVGSNVFRSFVADMIQNTQAYDLDTDAYKAALFLTTPDNVTARDDTAAHNIYNAASGQWLTTSQPATSGNWPQAGVALAFSGGTGATGARVTTGAGFFMMDADDVAPGGTNTLASVFGTMVYDTTVASNGVCCNYFGGSQSVTAGTFTIVWNANGVYRVTM